MRRGKNRLHVTIEGRRLSCVRHPWLGRDSYRTKLLRFGRKLAERGEFDRSCESRAFQALQASAYAAHVAVEGGAGPDAPEVRALIELYDALCDVLFRGNLGLVVEMKRRFVNDCLDDSDVISDGQLALLRAVRSFDPWKGYRFSTYACRSILRAFGELRERHVRRTRLFAKAAERHRETQGAERCSSYVDYDATLEDLKSVLVENKAGLSDTEMLIINQRVFRPGLRSATLAVVGKMVNLSKERVRQIQDSAIKKLCAAVNTEWAIARDALATLDAASDLIDCSDHRASAVACRLRDLAA